MNSFCFILRLIFSFSRLDSHFWEFVFGVVVVSLLYSLFNGFLFWRVV